MTADQSRVPHQRGRKLFWPRADAIRAVRLRLEQGKPIIPRDSSRLGAKHIIEFFGLVTELAAPGLTPWQLAAAKAWGTRRTKYGDRGYVNKPGCPGNQHAKRTHCMRGHKYRPGSFWKTRNGRRQCKACAAIWAGQRNRNAIARRRRAEAIARARDQMKAAGIRNAQEPSSAYWRDRYVAARERWQRLKAA